jgi:hypothetical protein
MGWTFMKLGFKPLSSSLMVGQFFGITCKCMWVVVDLKGSNTFGKKKLQVEH